MAKLRVTNVLLTYNLMAMAVLQTQHMIKDLATVVGYLPELGSKTLLLRRLYILNVMENSGNY